MDTAQFFQAFLALIFVLGLLLLTLWLIKYAQQKGLNCRLGKSFASKAKIKILEQHRLDIKNSVILLQYENEDFLLLLGPQNNLLLKQTKHTKESAAK